ncbi:hypothetical protein Pfra02_45570 [Pseudomonas fragi]|nr:hypothetical protein Pfra02_45570 [Pseudomonas fragi]
MDMLMISEQLVLHGVCKDIRSANTTALYALKWQQGVLFDFKNRSVQLHSNRLVLIGVNIKLPFVAVSPAPYPNERTVTWTPKVEGKGGRLQYRKAYDKAFEIQDKSEYLPVEKKK